MMIEDPSDDEKEIGLVNSKQVQSQNVASNLHYIIVLISIPLVYGNKLFCLDLARLNQVWVYFIEAIGMFLTAVVLYLIARKVTVSTESQRNLIFREKKAMIACIITGISNS